MKRVAYFAVMALTVLALAASGLGIASAQPVPGGTLNPTTIPKYAEQLAIPPVMPKTSTSISLDYYEIAVRQFQQQVLPTGMSQTTVWGYGSLTDPNSFSYPARTIEATYNKQVRIKWINDLKNPDGTFIPHLLPVDATLHWANPVMGPGMTDMRPPSNPLDPFWSDLYINNGRYTGPVPMVTHVHGAHVADDSDGYPEAWFLPTATNIPSTYGTSGSFYDFFAGKALTRFGETWTPGSAVFQYSNDQRATTLWYHDHTLGMTRLNVYAGPAGFYLIRGNTAGDGSQSDLDVKVKKTGLPAVLPTGAREIPLVIQDKSFNTDGSLFFPDNRAFFEGLNVQGTAGTNPQFPGAGELRIPFFPDPACILASDIAPIFNPEFFGNTMVVNGKTWPNLQVEPKRYRFRMLNGCNSRFVILRLVTASNINKPGTWMQVPLPFAQIGSEGGFLPAVATQNELLIGLAERADVIIDFSKFPVGSFVYLVNVGPDSPFGGGVPGKAFPPADPGTTGQVMRFQIMPAVGKDTTTPAGQLQLPFTPNTQPATVTRKLSLNEVDSATVLVSADKAGNVFLDCANPLALPFGPKEALLGTMDAANNPQAKPWMDDITENPALGATEVWEIYNFTADAHPIHVHQTMFQVINRQNLVVDAFGMTVAPAVLVGAPLPPAVSETGFKDTVIVYPGMVTRLKATFDLNGLYVWHCHIIDHEDNEMMRPMFIGDPTGYPVTFFAP